MRNLGAILLAVLFAFSSCVKYQYVAMQSEEARKEKNYWLFENESLRMEYYFMGQNVPVSMRFTNKTSEYMYIDWRNSFVVINPNRASANFIDHNYVYTPNVSNDEMRLPMTDFIRSFLVHKVQPFQSIAFNRMYQLRNEPFDLKHYPAKEFERNFTKDGIETRKINLYTLQDSPLRFAKEWVIHFGEVGQKTQKLNHLFYVQKAVNTGPNLDWPAGESITLLKDNTDVAASLASIALLSGLLLLVLQMDVEYDDGW